MSNLSLFFISKCYHYDTYINVILYTISLNAFVESIASSLTNDSTSTRFPTVNEVASLSDDRVESKFLLLYENSDNLQDTLGALAFATARTTRSFPRSRFLLISIALDTPDVSTTTRNDHEENRPSISWPVSSSIPGGRGVYGPLKSPDTSNFSPYTFLFFSVALSFSRSSESRSPTAAILKV